MMFSSNHLAEEDLRVKTLLIAQLKINLYTFMCTYIPVYSLDCSKDAWGKILQALGTNEIDLRDKRYHQVIHMVTAANGAEKFYSLDNNATRSESPELARELDTKVSQVKYIATLLM